MITLGSTLQHTPVMGIQTGSELATLKKPVINPSDLAVVAYELDGSLLAKGRPSLLRIADIRELSDMGAIVDSSDEFISPTDVISIQKIYDLHFPLIGMKVVNERNRKLGKVVDFTVETGGFIIQQLTVRRPILASLNDTELLIHRSQITAISNDVITVHSMAEVPEPERQDVIGSYVNPFRKSEPAAGETIHHQ